jgi:Asp/Glu/hydantoin racemase
MRIAVLGLMDTGHLAPHAPDGIELVIYPPRIGAFPHTPYDRLLVDLAHVDAAERAADDGVDAILIDSTCDWGIEAIRASVDIPVVGAGEVGIAEASAGGRRFGIVTIWPPALEFLYTERARTVPGGERCTGIRYASADHELARLGDDESVIARMDRREKPVLDRLVEECRRSVADDGAEAILLGCTCMARTAPLIEERFDDVPVIEAARSALKATLTAEPGRRNRTGLTGVARALVDTWVVGAPSPQLPDAEECNVCAQVELGEQLDRV